jgi:hypothetical protein
MSFEIYRIDNGARVRITTGIGVNGFCIERCPARGRQLVGTFLQMAQTDELDVPRMGDLLEVRSVLWNGVVQVSQRVFFGQVSEVRVSAEPFADLLYHRFVAQEIEDPSAITVTYSDNTVYAAGERGDFPVRPRGPVRPSIPVIEETGRRKITREELPE